MTLAGQETDEMFRYFVGLLPWCAVAIVVLSWLLWAPSKAESKWWNGPVFWLVNRHGSSIATAARTVGARFADIRDRKLSHQLGEDDESDDLYTKPAYAVAEQRERDTWAEAQRAATSPWPAPAPFGADDGPVERDDPLPGSRANPIPVDSITDRDGVPVP